MLPFVGAFDLEQLLPQCLCHPSGHTAHAYGAFAYVLQSVGDKIKDAAGDAKDAIKGGAGNVKDAAGSAASKVKNVGKDAGDKADDASGDAQKNVSVSLLHNSCLLSAT